jgi:xanthine dehydrogenase YagS FAD-binding subunit
MAAEALLVGNPPDRERFEAAAEQVLAGAQGYSHNAFKIELARRAIVRGLSQAAEGTPQSQTDKRIR